MNEDRAQPPTSPSSGPSCCDLSLATGEESVASLKAALQDVQAELIACQRLALLGSLTAMAAHEFNNLMTPITARVEAALCGDDVPFMRKALERTLTHAQRAIAVTRHLLALAHGNHHSTEICSVAGAVREAIETATRPFEKDGIALQVSVPEELAVCAREDLLCQVLLNLMLNARQAMKGLEGVLAIIAVSDGNYVQIDVSDSGKGILADLLENVINPFLAADPSVRPNDWQRVGLGLSVCRMIAHHHGAALRAFANEGRGCTFRLRWPKRPPQRGP
ncbi:MAG: HAMP domain-containing histidine kinase [Phycisphaerae bacterium]|nr:HAMP domain-containing histidine kinase [Phycisphaerae bacterium]